MNRLLNSSIVKMRSPIIVTESILCLPQPRPRTNRFMYDDAKPWNSIPKEIRESRSLSCFQNKIPTHVL